jgi:biofilm PGA synthesis N-glycosyltransferase PgaC
VLIGYSWTTLLFACAALYLFYVFIEILHVLSSYAVADDYTKGRIEECGWPLLGMPIYRLIVFYYRFSGYLVTLKDEQRWDASGPVETTRRDLQSLRLRSLQVSSLLGTGMTRVSRATTGLAGVLFLVLLMVLGWMLKVQDFWRHLRS